jgi:hypothetical protein
MGQFKPMVKMETTEPSVILKLKKGGHVSSAKDENGHTNMKGMAFKAKYSEEACEGDSPKKPSMSDRRKAMSGATMKNGGKVDKKAMGGMMGAPAMAAPMAAPRGARMDPRKAAMMKALMARKAAMGAPAMPMAPMAAPGGMPAMKKGGKASDTAQDKAMIAKAMKQHDAQEHKGGKGTKLKLATGGLTNPMKKGGSINDFLHTKTVKMKTAEGYQKYATGGAVSGNALKTVNMVTTPGTAKYADGGAVSGNALKTVNMVTAGKATGGVVNGMATGGLTNPMKKGGRASSRPVNTGKMDPGYERYATGGLTNPMKKGGAAKKHFATGGSVSTGHAVAMPKRPVSQPVSTNRIAGTFKKGGTVGSEMVDASKGAYDKAIGPGEDEMEMAKAFRDPVGSMKRLLGIGSKPTEKQVIHTGGYKKGGNAKC